MSRAGHSRNHAYIGSMRELILKMLAAAIDDQGRALLNLSCGVPEEYAQGLEDKGYALCELANSVRKDAVAA